ncbi:MAG: helix-turn-helix domain-containing protein [Butyricicoccus sp.]
MKKDRLQMKFGDLVLISTYFVNEAFGQNHAQMVHKHSNRLELLYVSEGEGRYQVGHREYAIRQGDLVICNNNVLHGEAPFQQHTMQTYSVGLSQVKVDSLPENCMIDEEQKPVLSLSTEESEVIHQLMQTVHRCFSEQQKDELLCNSLAASIFLLAWRKYQMDKASADWILMRKNESLVRQIVEYLDSHFTEPITLEQISAEFHISTSHLSHLFKRETGTSPMQYVIYRRIGEAQSMLMGSDYPIGQIEELLGFGSGSHLNAMFKKYVGVSPKEYREHFSRRSIRKKD